MRDFVLIATLGSSDIQLVAPVPGSTSAARRLWLDKEDLRAFHQFCLDHRSLVRVLPLEEVAALGRPKGRARFLPGEGHCTFEVAGEGPLFIDCGSQPVTLCCGILGETYAHIRKRQDKGKLGGQCASSC